MLNFTKSDFTFNGITYKRYTGDRKRGGSEWVFFGQAPYDMTYSPIWSEAISINSTFEEVKFIANICGDEICVDFLDDLTISEEDDLDALYTAHVAPVPV